MDEGFDAALVKSVSSWLGTGSINIFGLPFAGKDTQSRKLAELLKAALIGGGDILRSNQAFANTLAKVEDGSLAPRNEYLKVVTPYLSKSSLANKPFILNSLGRWYGEEKGILEAAEKSGHPTKAVIYIIISEDEFRRRWQSARQKGDRGSRADDAETALAKRLGEFQNKTLPVIEFYRSKGLLVEVDGQKDVRSVTTDILTGLSEYAKSHSN